MCFVTGAGGSAAFDHANTQRTASGATLEQLDPSGSIRLIYRASLANTVQPDEVLSNAATLAASTLRGGQWRPERDHRQRRQPRW